MVTAKIERSNKHHERKFAHKRFHHCEISHKFSEHSLWHLMVFFFSTNLTSFAVYLIHILCVFICLFVSVSLDWFPFHSRTRKQHFQHRISQYNSNSRCHTRANTAAAAAVAATEQKNKLFIVNFSTCILKNINVI